MVRFSVFFRIAALIAVIVLSACASGAKMVSTVPVNLRGTWIGMEDDAKGATLVFTSDTFTYKKGNGSYTMGSLSFKETANRDPFTKSIYPSGYQFHGVHIDGTGNYKKFIGNEADEDPMFLNTEKTKLCWSGENWIFTNSKGNRQKGRPAMNI